MLVVTDVVVGFVLLVTDRASGKHKGVRAAWVLSAPVCRPLLVAHRPCRPPCCCAVQTKEVAEEVEAEAARRAEVAQRLSQQTKEQLRDKMGEGRALDRTNLLACGTTVTSRGTRLRSPDVRTCVGCGSSQMQ